MSSVTAASSTYSDLDARTEFVLNRVAFLDSVTSVLLDENQPENAQKVTVWRDNNYIPLIVRSIMDPNEEIYDRAIWATANLLVSDDPQVAVATRAAITDEVLKRLVQMAGYVTLTPTVRNGIHYLFSNLSQYYTTPRFFTEAVGNSLLNTVLDKRLAANLGSKALTDFLETVKHIAKKDPSAINAYLLIDALFDPYQTQKYSELMSRNYSRLFHIIGTLAEQDSMISPPGIHQLLKYFTKQLASSEPDVPRREMLWVLSNILTEPTAPELFADEHHKELKNLVESLAWNELDVDNESADEDVGYEALFALVNFVSSAKHMSEEFQKNVADDYDLSSLFLTRIAHDNVKVAAVAREGYDLISQLRATFYPAPTPIEVVETHWDETESDSECEEYEDTETDTENDVVVTIKNDACVGVATCEKPVPSASDLVLGALRGNESGAVRRVVSLLVNEPVGEWIEVPSDWTLTVSDLTTLQHLGYTIKDGHVGINPEVYSAY